MERFKDANSPTPDVDVSIISSGAAENKKSLSSAPFASLRLDKNILCYKNFKFDY